MKPILKPILREWLVKEENTRKRAFDVFVALLTIVSIVCYLVYLSNALPPDLDETLRDFDFFVVVAFALEYLARFHCSTDFFADWRKKGPKAALRARVDFMLQPMSIIDLLALLPALRVVRLFRLFRLFRLLRLVRHTSSFGSVAEVFREHAFELGSVFIFFLAVLTVSGTAMFLVENPVDHKDTQFQTIGDAFWWAIVSMTTVGYGDKVPTTLMGRIVAGLVILTGVFAIAFPTAIITSAFLDKLSRLKEGTLTMKRLSGHIVICGLNKATEVVVNELELAGARKGEATDIVVVSSFAAPGAAAPGHAVLRRGDITRESTLREAGVEQAAAVIILSERRTSETPDETVDARTILCAMHVDSLNPEATIIAEIVESENVKTLVSRVPRVEVVESGALAPRLMAVGTVYRGTAAVITDLLTVGENDFFEIEVNEALLAHASTFADLFAPFRQRLAIPIAVRRKRDTSVNPENGFKLERGDIVLAIGREPFSM